MTFEQVMDITDWIFRELGLDHDETWGSDHLDHQETARKLLKLTGDSDDQENS